jgi:hypothetical protein
MIKGDISREELEDELVSVFDDITHDRNLIKTFEEYLYENHNMLKTKTNGVLGQSIPIQDLEMEELYLFAKLAYEYCRNDKEQRIDELNPTKYFLPKEIDNGENYKEVRVVNTSQKLEFENVIEMVYDQYKVYICSVTLQQIGDIMSRGLYEYDPNTQRQLTKKVLRSGKVSAKPPRNTTKINAIKKTLEKSSPNQNEITFNVPPTGDDQFNYKNGKIEIVVDGVKTRMKLIDGWNRFRGANELYKENPEAKCPFLLRIFHMSDQNARAYISSVNEQTKIEDYHVETMKEDSPYMAMAKVLNTKGNEQTNALYMRITEDLFDVENGKHYTTFNVLNQSLEFNFNGKNKERSMFERLKIQDFLLDGFIYILGAFEDEFKNKKQSREVSIVTEANTFIGYVSILAELYDNHKDNWKEKILDILGNVDFYKTGALEKEWKDMGIYTKNFNTTHVKKISNYFKQFVK